MYQNKLKKYRNKISFKGGSSQENTWNCKCGIVNQNGIGHCKECNAPEPLKLGGQEPSTPVSLFGSQEGESPQLSLGLAPIIGTSGTSDNKNALNRGIRQAKELGYSAPSGRYVSPSLNEREEESLARFKAGPGQVFKNAAQEELEKRQREEANACVKPQKKYPNSPHQGALSGTNTSIPELDLEETKEETKKQTKNESCIIF
jgi:hypothetical protein